MSYLAERRVTKHPEEFGKGAFPAVIMFCCMGVYAVSGHVFHCWLVIIVALFGYAARFLDLPAAPFILGFVLGPMMEENFRRSLLRRAGTSPFSSSAL